MKAHNTDEEARQVPQSLGWRLHGRDSNGSCLGHASPSSHCLWQILWQEEFAIHPETLLDEGQMCREGS